MEPSTRSRDVQYALTFIVRVTYKTFPMNLSDYMTKSEASDADVAAAVGVHRVSVTRYRSGKQKPSIEVLARLTQWSNGEVTAIDFIRPGNGGA
jgi:transcriptional regulator with XRE-family HTH domain